MLLTHFWGYSTARPDHAGSGLRAFATVHTPGLMLTGRLAGIALDLTNQGFGINPIWGGAGGIMQVSNLGSQGEPEYEAIQRIENVSKDIVEKERAVRKTFVRENSYTGARLHGKGRRHYAAFTQHVVW